MPNFTLINLNPALRSNEKAMHDLVAVITRAAMQCRPLGLPSEDYVHVLEGGRPFYPKTNPVPLFIRIYMHGRSKMTYDEYEKLATDVATEVFAMVKDHHNLVDVFVEAVETLEFRVREFHVMVPKPA